MRPIATLTLALGLLAATGCCCFPAPSGSGSSSDTAPAAEEAAPARVVENGARLVAISVELPTLKPNGQAWDIAGGAPDPRVRVRQDGYTVYDSPVVRDTYEADFTVSDEALIDPARPFVVDVIDNDASAHDTVDSIRLSIPTSPTFSTHGRNGTVLTVTVERAGEPPGGPAPMSAAARAFPIERGREYTPPGFTNLGDLDVGPVVGPTQVEDEGIDTLGEVASRYQVPGFHFDVTDWGQPVIVRERDGARFSFHIADTFLTFDSKSPTGGYDTAEVFFSDGGDDCSVGVMRGNYCQNIPESLR